MESDASKDQFGKWLAFSVEHENSSATSNSPVKPARNHIDDVSIAITLLLSLKVFNCLLLNRRNRR